MKSKSVEQLILAIRKEYEVYQDILALSLQKRDLIVEGKIKELEGLTAKEQALILSVGKLEEIRASIINNIKVELNIVDIKDIEDLAHKVDSELGLTLLSLKRDFSKLLKQVKDSNDLNGRLIHDSLEYLEFNKNLLSSIDDSAPIYNGKADDNVYTKEKSLFDLKV